jgi:hypothetical protein
MYLIIIGLITILISILLLNNGYSILGTLCLGIGAVMMNRGYKKNK